MFDLPESAILFADSARGVFIPQHFAESVRRDCVTGVSAEDWAILESGPDTESYWDVWCDVESRAVVTAPLSGIAYTLYQDGDLWLVPADWQPEQD
jgi:hypothetical protein